MMDGWLPWASCGLIVLAGVLAYSDSLGGPFVFDDGYVTTNNLTIRQLWPLSVPLSPPADSTSGGRPLLNLSYAINYAWDGLDPFGYHLVNLLIHLLAGLTLFGVVRRTLDLVGTRVPSRPTHESDGRGLPSLPLALAVALLWLVHPLQTESVTYLSQRAESLMGLFYLLTFYCFIRSTESKQTLWSFLCVFSCLLGMATKEVMVTAPLLILIYDRTFVAGSFRVAWQLRGKLYAGLMSTWLLLGYLLRDVGQRSVGTGLGVSPWSYALTQCWAIPHYLRLVVWPVPLVIDYGTTMISDPLSVLPQGLLLLLLLALTGWALIRQPILGFAGAWFFLILAPTSSVIPMVLEPAAEHRIYLPLAALLTLLVVGLHQLIGKHCLWIVAALALTWATLTYQRNDDYASALTLWQVTSTQIPTNPRAHNNYGELLLQEGQAVEAGDQFREALRLKSDYPEAQTNLGNALRQEGQFSEALGHYEKAIQIDPPYVDAQYNLGNLLLRMGRTSDAAEHYEAAVRIKPNDPEAHNNLGVVWAQLGRKSEAINEFQEALRLDPDYTPASTNLSQLEALSAH